MPDFSKGKIYKLISNKSSDVYIGSCLVDLSKRLYGHKSKSNTAVSKSMFVDDAIISIVLIEDYACYNKNQLKARELHYITTINCINKNKPFITDVNEDYKEWKKQYTAQYYETNKEQIALQQAQYKVINKEQIAQREAQYKVINKEQIAQQKAQYYETNKEQRVQRQAQYDAAHKEEKAQYQKQYYQLQKLKQSS